MRKIAHKAQQLKKLELFAIHYVQTCRRWFWIMSRIILPSHIPFVQPMRIKSSSNFLVRNCFHNCFAARLCLKKKTNKSKAIYLFNKNNLCPLIVDQSEQKFQQSKPTRTRQNNHLVPQFQSPPWTQSARLSGLIKRSKEHYVNNTAFITQRCLEWLHPTPQSADVAIIVTWYIVTESDNFVTFHSDKPQMVPWVFWTKCSWQFR